MPDVIDKATGQTTSVPEADAAKGFQEGRYQLVSGQRYQVQLASGAYGTVPAEHVAAALQAGASLASPEQAKAAYQQSQFGDERGAAIAGATSLLSQSTGGLTDQAALAAGGRHLTDLVSDTEEQHPIAAGVGGAAGALALGAATGGEALAEGAATRGAARLGLREGGLAARALVGGARGTVAGLQQGVAQSISDDAFSDHHLTAQQILSTVGGNVLWGGGLGAGFGLLGGAAQGLRGGEAAAQPPPAAKTAIEEAIGAGERASDEDVGKVAARAVGLEQPADGLGSKIRGWYTKASAAASGKDSGAIGKFLGGELEPGSLGYANRRALLEADEVRDQAARDLRAHGDAMLTASRDVNEIWGRGLKRSYIAGAVDGVDASEAAHRSRALVDHAMSTLNDMLDNADDYGGRAPLSRAVKVTSEVSRKLDAAIAGHDFSVSGSGNVGEMYALVDDLKKGIGKYTKGATRLSPGAATDELIALQNRARAGKLQDLYDTLRVGLEDEGLWKKMGTNQKTINSAFTTQIDASDRFHAALTTDIGRDPNNPWSTARGVDPGKAGAYVRGLITPEKDLTHQAVSDYVASTKALAGAMAEAFDLPPDKVKSVAQIAASAEAMRGTLDRAAKSLSLVNQFEKIRDVTSGHATAFGALAGMASHGIGGGIAGLALGKIGGVLTRPADTIMQLAAVEKMARESDGRIARALRGFARGIPRSAPSTVPDTATYARKAAAVQRIASAPDTLASRIGGNLGALRTTAPRLADALTGASLRGIALLRDKLPAQVPGDPLDPEKKPPLPPPAAREAWLRYERAVEHPLDVVDDLRDGRLNMEGVEVLRTVHPDLFARVQQKTFEEMTAGKLRNLDHQQRIGLGLLLDLPTDPTLAPAYVLARQSAFTTKAQDDGSKREGRPINLSKMTPNTASQRIESAQN